MLNISNSLSILGLGATATLSEVKTAYRKAAAKYHPDRNPAGAEMMKLVNGAYDSLQEFFKKNPDLENVESYSDDASFDYGEAINNALNAVLNLSGLHVEVCGAWVWVSGETKEHKEALKAANFKWAAKKKMWYFRPEGEKSRKNSGTYSMEKIRESYGSQVFKQGARKELN